MNTNFLLEYLNILLRRKTAFLLVAGAIFAVSVVFALKWSNYRAFATVEVAQPQIAVNIGNDADNFATLEAMADLQISRIRQKVLSTGSLVEIISKLDLYPEARRRTPIAYIAEDMRQKIKVQLVSTSLANPASAQKASATQLSAIAFVLSFEHDDPLLAQQTVNELVSRFLDEDLKERRNTSERTVAFLESQIKVLAESLAEQEKNIAEFRAANGDVRPDLLVFNQQIAASTTSRLQAIESELISNLGLQGALRAQLAQTDPYSRIIEDGQILTTPSIQLRALKSQYATLTAKYGEEHPDVIKVSRQIDALEAGIDPAGFSSRIKAKINDARARLDKARNTYGEEHPDVLSLRRQLERLNEQLAEARKSGASISSSPLVKKDADNPAYMQIIAQLEAAEAQYGALEKQKEEVRRQQEEYQLAIVENPAAEQHLAALARDYDNSLSLYRELKAKKLAAEMNRKIEQDQSGRRLVVINSPELPLETQPSRKLIIAAGFVFSVMGGLGSVIGLQLLSGGVIGPRHLESLVGVAPLATIPHLRTLDEKIARRRRNFKILWAALVLAVAGILLFSLVVMPLDLLWAVLAQRAGF